MTFSKYHGAGNDFVLIDDRDESFNGDVANLCHRRFGIGADGLMLLRDHPDYDFEMVYYNSDGNLTSMCGNGGRCIVRFAHDQGVIEDSCRFLAVDGPHDAHFEGDRVALQMKDVDGVEKLESGDCVLDTGSPHYVQFRDELPENVFKEGGEIRNSEPYKEEGINVNFVVRKEDNLKIATFERGIEDETYACGTGVTAAVLADRAETGKFDVAVKAKGGDLSVRGRRLEDGSFEDIWLVGPAELVFTGRV